MFLIGDNREDDPLSNVQNLIEVGAVVSVSQFAHSVCVCVWG